MGSVIFDQIDADVRPEGSATPDEQRERTPSPTPLDALELRRLLVRARQLDARRYAD